MDKCGGRGVHCETEGVTEEETPSDSWSFGGERVRMCEGGRWGWRGR